MSQTNYHDRTSTVAFEKTMPSPKQVSPSQHTCEKMPITFTEQGDEDKVGEPASIQEEDQNYMHEYWKIQQVDYERIYPDLQYVKCA